MGVPALECLVWGRSPGLQGQQEVPPYTLFPSPLPLHPPLLREETPDGEKGEWAGPGARGVETPDPLPRLLEQTWRCFRKKST